MNLNVHCDAEKKPVFCYWLKHIAIIVNFHRYYAIARDSEAKEIERERWMVGCRKFNC